MMKRCVTLALLGFLTVSTGCESCGDKPEPPKIETPPPVKVTATPDVGTPDLGDPLKEAKESALKVAELAAIQLGENARGVVGAMEANKKKTTRVIRKGPSYTNCRGKVDAKKVKKVFNRYSSFMKKCYERALKKNPGLEGKVKLSVTVGKDGKVKKTKVGGSLREPTVAKCMQMEAQKMSFPNPEGGCVLVNKSYTFSPDF
jgi:hypothetical protein